MVFESTNQTVIIGGEQPFFSHNYTTTGNIAATARSNERFISEEHEWQHAPFDTIVISNRDSVDLNIELDGNPDNAIPVKSGMTITADKQKFRNFTIKNLDAANAHTAGLVNILVQNTKKRGRA